MASVAKSSSAKSSAESKTLAKNSTKNSTKTKTPAKTKSSPAPGKKKEPYTFWSETTSIFLSYLTLFLVLAILIASLVMARYIYTWWECGANPDISCFDDWYCPGTAYDKGSTGYASSLFGPQSQASVGCNYTQPGGQCALAGVSTCSADQQVPLGCTCSYLGANSSKCLQLLCSVSQPGWQPGGQCPAVSGS